MGIREDLMGASFSALQADTVVPEATTTESKYPLVIDGQQVYLKKIEFGALPDTTTKSVAHGITGLDQVIQVWGWAEHSNGSRFSIPHADATSSADCIECRGNATNLQVQTGADQSNLSANFYMLYTKD